MEENILTKIERLLQEAMKEKGVVIEKLNNLEEGVDKEKANGELSVVENKLRSFRMMKAELIKTNDKKEYTLTEEQEIKALTKMKEEREKYIDVYKKAKREELAELLSEEISVITKFLPAQPDEEEVKKFTSNAIDKYLSEKEDGYQLSKRDMGKIMPIVKAVYPNVNGKLVESVLNSKMG